MCLRTSVKITSNSLVLCVARVHLLELKEFPLHNRTVYIFKESDTILVFESKVKDNLFSTDYTLL